MRLIVGTLLAVSLLGCGYGYHHHGHVHTQSTGLAIGAGMLAGAAIVAASQNERPREEPAVVYNTYYVNSPMPPPVAQPYPKDRVPPREELSPFDPNAARSALNGIDVSSCQASGAPRGYGHAKVVWNPDGTISKVTVDEPSGLSAEAAKCVGDKLGTATVPPFRGSLVTVGTTWYVP